VMAAAPKIACQTLVVHAREDELTSLRSANFLVEKIGGGRARMIVLEDSYHMVCVDNDREIVAKNVLEFFGAALPGATSALANEPRMTVDDLMAATCALKKAPDNDTLLALYAFYKQASAGDVTGDRPGALDMVGCAKYDAWAKKRGVGRDEAMKGYVALVAELKKREGN
jgi:carboxylesterase